MGVNFHSSYGQVLLGCIEIYIGLFLFAASFFIDKYNLRRNKPKEAQAFFAKLHLSKKSLIIVSMIFFVFSILLLILYLDLPEGQSLKNTLTWPLVILGAVAFAYNSLIDSKNASDGTNKSAVIDHLVKNKSFYKNLVGGIFCGIFIIVGIKTLFS